MVGVHPPVHRSFPPRYSVHERALVFFKSTFFDCLFFTKKMFAVVLHLHVLRETLFTVVPHDHHL